jgi:hypothetical protein
MLGDTLVDALDIMRKFNIGGVVPAQPTDELTCTNLPAGVEPCGSET